MIVQGITVTPYTALYSSPILDSNIVASLAVNEGRGQLVLDFNQGDGVYSRDIGTLFSWPLPSHIILDTWQPSIIPQPENEYNRPGDWIGTEGGAKFIQGVIVDADSFNVPKTFQLQSSDDLSLHTLLECPAQFPKRTKRAFSCVPFIAHSARRISQDDIPWKVWGEELVYQPLPELAMNWTTEKMSYGLGWGHIKMLNIPYIASATLSVVLNFDQWPSIATQLSPTSTVLKQKVLLPVNKFKLVSFSVTSSAPFRLFKEMLEVWYGEWGRTESYRKVQPFGGHAADGAEV